MTYRFCSQTQSLMIQLNSIKKSQLFKYKNKTLVVNQATYLMFYDSIDELIKITQPQIKRERGKKCINVILISQLLI